MRTARIILFGTLALLGLGIAGLASFVWFGGADAHRWVAHKALEAALDHDVQIDGDITVVLGAEPLLQLTDLRIDSPPWAESPTLLEVDRAEIRIALRPLLQRVIVFPHFALNGVTASFETAADGRKSWETDHRPGSTQERGESVRLPIFQEVSISDATLIVHDLQDGRRNEVHIASLTNRTDAESGGTRLDVQGSINGQAFKIGGTTGSLDMALAAIEPYPVNFAVQLPAIDIQIAGTIDDLTGAQILDLRLLARSPSLRDAIEAWNLTVPFDLEVAAEARVAGEFAELALADVSARIVGIGGDRLTLNGGSIDVWEGTGLEGRVLANLDPMGGIMRFLPERWRIAEGVDVAASLSGSIAAPALEDLSAEIRGPGDSSVSLSGYVRASTGQQVQLEALDITAALAVPDPSTLADQLGVNPSGLGPWRGEGRLVLADQQFAVSELRFDATDLGTLSFEPGGAIGVSSVDDVLRFAPDISFNLNLPESGPAMRLIDVELPEFGPVQATGRLFMDDSGYRLGDLDIDLGSAETLAANLRGGVGPLIAEDAGATELDLTVTLGWSSSQILGVFIGQDLPELGRADGQFGLAGTFADMRMRDASLQTRNDAGIVVTASGDVAHIRTLGPFAVAGLALDLEVQAPAVSDLANFFGYEAPDLGPVYGQAALADHDGLMALTAIRIRAGPVQAPNIEVSGTIGDLTTFQMVDLEAKFGMPTNDLLALADIDGKSALGRVDGRIRLSNADGPVNIERFEAQVTETQLLSLAIEGSIDDLENIDLVEVEASLEVPNVAILAEVFDADLSGLRALRFDGKLSGDGQRFNADGRAALGETRIDGVVSGDFTGPRPSFKGTLHSPLVRLADLGIAPQHFDDEPGEVEATDSDPWLFDSTPIPIETLGSLDLDISIRIDELEGISLAVDQADAHVLLQDGLLNIESLRFRLVGGRALANAEVDTHETPPTWWLHMVTDDADLGDIWRQIETEVPLSGELDLELDMRATGRSPRDLAKSLSGELNVALQRGQLQTSLFYLTVSSPVRWLGSGSTRRGYAEINCLLGRFHIRDGVADADVLLLDTPNAIATGQGDIDFAQETFDLQISPSARRRRVADLTTPFAIRGGLTSPAIEFSSGGAAVRVIGEIALSPVNLLGSLLPFVGDNGSDQDNPCLTLSDVTVDP